MPEGALSSMTIFMVSFVAVGALGYAGVRVLRRRMDRRFALRSGAGGKFAPISR